MFNLSSAFEKHYKQILCEDLLLKLNLPNINQMPKITQTILSTTSERVATNQAFIVHTVSGLELISGQKLLITKAKKSISTFKLREKQIIGAKVNLRQHLMYHFLEKMFFIVLPRCRSLCTKEMPSRSTKSENLLANYNFGFDEEFILYPELESHYEFFEYLKGCNVNISIGPKSTLISVKKLLLTGFYIIL